MKTILRYVFNCAFCALLLGGIVFIIMVVGLAEFEYCVFWAIIAAMFGAIVPLLDIFTNN